MPYTNPWSDTDPPGSQAADTIDDELRQLRLDIHERMDNIVEDWEADPVVPLAAGGVVKSAIQYDDLNSAGVKALNDETILASLTLHYSGVTDSVGAITINLNEVNTTTGQDWQVANLYCPTFFALQSSPLLVTGFYNYTEHHLLGLSSVVLSAVANTIRLFFKVASSDAVLATQSIAIVIQLHFTAAP